MSVTAIRLYTRGHDIIVDVERRGEWHEVIRTHGALDHVTVDHCARVDDWVVPRDVDEAAIAGKHRESVLDTLRELADWLDPARLPNRPTHPKLTEPLELTTILGWRNRDTDEVTLVVRVLDPHEVLRKGYSNIEGMHQVAVGDFSADKAQVAERLSIVFAEDAIAMGRRS